MKLCPVCIGQSPYTFELDDDSSIDDKISAEITNHVTFKIDGYDSLSLVSYTILTQQNFQCIVIDPLRVSRTKLCIDPSDEVYNHINLSILFSNLILNGSYYPATLDAADHRWSDVL